MSGTKNYSVKILTKEDEPEIDELMKKNPLWSRRVARDAVARRKFIRRIMEAK